MENNKGWQCPCCGIIYSPLITQCTCNKKTSSQGWAEWVYKPSSGWSDNITNKENKEYYSGIPTLNGGWITCNSCGISYGEASHHMCATTLS